MGDVSSVCLVSFNYAERNKQQGTTTNERERERMVLWKPFGFFPPGAKLEMQKKRQKKKLLFLISWLSHTDSLVLSKP